ncbi:MAG: hypothetical protein ACFFDT_33540, partial [Candidatus Hodarchaeota archaeon]
MKKIIISMLVLLVILSTSSSVFAKGKGKGAGGQNRQTREVRSKNVAQKKRQAAVKDTEIDKKKIDTERQRVRADTGKVKKQ